MTAEWLQILEKQGAIVQRLRSQIPEILARDNLTLDQALLLHRIVEKGAQDVDLIARQIEEAELQEPFHDAARALQDLYRLLSASVAERLQVLRRQQLAVISE